MNVNARRKWQEATIAYAVKRLILMPSGWFMYRHVSHSKVVSSECICAFLRFSNNEYYPIWH